MAVKVSLDFQQLMISEILTGLNYVSQIDDCGIWTDTTFEQHMKLVIKVLSHGSLKYSPLKCNWAIK